jgi:hypothetical protein
MNICYVHRPNEHMDLNLTTYVRRLTDEYNVCLLAYIDISSVFRQHILIIFCSGKTCVGL